MTEYKAPFKMKKTEFDTYEILDGDKIPIGAECLARKTAKLIVTALNKLMVGEAPPKERLENE